MPGDQRDGIMIIKPEIKLAGKPIFVLAHRGLIFTEIPLDVMLLINLVVRFVPIQENQLGGTILTNQQIKSVGNMDFRHVQQLMNTVEVLCGVGKFEFMEVRFVMVPESLLGGITLTNLETNFVARRGFPPVQQHLITMEYPCIVGMLSFLEVRFVMVLESLLVGIIIINREIKPVVRLVWDRVQPLLEGMV